MAKHRSLRALILVLALIAAACGGADESTSVEAASPADDVTDGAGAESDDDSNSDDHGDDGDGDAAADQNGDDGNSDAATDHDGDDSAAMADDDDAEATAPSGGPPASLPPEEARSAAEQNIPNLQPSDDVRDIEVVSVFDGSATSLREVVTGDRPVLVWFWAPH